MSPVPSSPPEARSAKASSFAALASDPVLAKLREGKTPTSIRLAIARGALPLDAPLLTTALALLLKDPEAEVAEAARSTLSQLPWTLILGLAGERDAPAEFLDAVTRQFSSREDLLERVVRSPAAADSTLEYVAGLKRPRILELLSNNQERLRACPRLIDALLANSALPRDRATYLTTYRRELEEQRQAREAAARAREAAPPLPSAPSPPLGRPAEPTAAPVAPEAAVRERPPLRAPTPPVGAPASRVFDASVLAPQAATEAVETVTAVEGTDLFGADALTEVEFEIPEEEVAPEQLTTVQRIAKMNVAQKIQLALLGTKEERGILIRDSNKMVALAAVKSPKMTESDIEAVAAMRNVHEDVLREIANNREYSKKYSVVQALVFNPRTPLGTSLSLLNRLHEKELKDLARSKDVAEAIRTSASRLLKQREARRDAKKSGGH